MGTGGVMLMGGFYEALEYISGRGPGALFFVGEELRRCETCGQLWNVACDDAVCPHALRADR